jgi:anion-transporting  ArsA/GET3 family ATPase
LDPATFFATSRVVIVAGKGGVGKTTVTAALARAAARQGRRALIVEVEGKSGLANMYGAEDLGYDEVTLAEADDPPGSGDVRARTLTPDEAMLEYLESHGLSRVAKRLVSSGAIDTLATAAPGIKDILVLGKVKQLERENDVDLIVLDAPAAGHAITFLRAARGLLDAVRVGPIHNQAAEVMEMLTDAERCQVVLVTLPEETPVNELIETAYNLEDQVGVALGPVVVNGLYPDRPGLAIDPVTAAAEAGVGLRAGEAEALTAAADFRRHRVQLQTEQVARLADQLPLPQLRLPFLFGAELGPAELDLLADRLVEQLETVVEA